ncbi:MAG: hypothetical protein AAFP85_02795 [Pseudomonadota bacterium]
MIVKSLLGMPPNARNVTMMSFRPRLYHMKPKDMRGDHLLPLNMLREVAPDVFAAQQAKYKGREAAPYRAIPELGCTWADCVQSSAVHPEAIRDAILKTGHAWPKAGRRFLVIDPARAGFNATNTAIYLATDTRPADFVTPKPDVVPYDPALLAHQDSIKTGTLDYLRQMRAAARRPLLFVGIPHVLHRGTIPLDCTTEIVV